jgi:hypothetical protein
MCSLIFRREHSAIITLFVRWSVGLSVCLSVGRSPHCFAPGDLAPGLLYNLFNFLCQNYTNVGICDFLVILTFNPGTPCSTLYSSLFG